jgi:hypothetical protein
MMMKSLWRFSLLALLLGLGVPELRANTMGVQEPAGFTSRIDGGGVDTVFDTTTDATGNVYVVGKTASSPEMGISNFKDLEDDATGRPGPAAQEAIANASGTQSAFVIKYDREGNVVWKRTGFANTFGSDLRATGVAVDATGNVFVTGSGTAFPIVFGNTTLTPSARSNVNFNNTLSGANNGNVWVVQYDRDGVMQWVRQFEYAAFPSTATNIANLGTEAPGAFVGFETDPRPGTINGTQGETQGRSVTIDLEGNLYVKMRVTAASTSQAGSNPNRVFWVRTGAGTGIVPVLSIDAGGNARSYAGTAFVAKLAATPPALGSPAGTPTTYAWRWIAPVTSGVPYDPQTGAISSIAPAGAAPSAITGLAADGDSLYLTGDWSGNLVAGGGTRTPFTTRDGYVARWRSIDAQPLYLATFSGATAGSGTSAGGAIVLNEQRNAFATGHVTNAAQLRLVSGDNAVTTRSMLVNSPTQTSFFIGKTSPAGQWQWSETPTAVATAFKLTATSLTRDAAGALYVGGAISDNFTATLAPGITIDGSSFVGNPLSPVFDAFVAKLTEDGAARTWRWALQTDGRDTGGIGNVPEFDTSVLTAGMGGTVYWAVQSYRPGRFASARSPDPADGAFDTTTSRGAFLLPVLTDAPALSPQFSIVTRLTSGSEVVPPAGVYRDANGFTLQPDITLPEAGGANGAARFHWDTFERKLYAVVPTLADIRWKVATDPVNPQRIVRRIDVVWPTPTQGLITHVTGAGPDGNEPKVSLESPAQSFNHTFSSVLYSENQAAVSGAKVFSTRVPGYSVLLYTLGKNTAAGAAPVRLEVVRSHLWTDPIVNSTNSVTIGREISGAVYNHGDPTGKNGYIVHAKARFDGTGEGAAHNRATQIGPIIPVNTDEPAADDDMAIIWSRVNPRGVAWPARTVTYTCSWPTGGALGGWIVIASQRGSESIPANYPIFPAWSERLDPAKYQSMAIYHQPDKNLAGYNPNEEHALLAPSNGGSGFQAAFALRSDLNNLGRTTSAPHVLLRYQDATDGLKTKFRVFSVLTEGVPGPVALPQYFTEHFSGGADVNDTEGFSYTFTPANTADRYTYTRDPAAAFPTNPSGGTNLSLTNNSSAEVALPAGTHLSLFGTNYTKFFVGSNGYVTFGAPDDRANPTVPIHFDTPRIAPLFTDLNPQAGGTISYKQIPDGWAVTWQDVPENLTTNKNSFQVEMFFDGRIRMTILSIDAPYGLMGLSRGTGSFADFFETNFSEPPLSYNFADFAGTAGRRVQAPYPLSLLGGGAGTTGSGTAYFKDRKNEVWAKAAGGVTARYFYPLLPSFWYDTNGDGTQDNVTEAPWLDRLAGQTIGTPRAVNYTISWPPTVPTLAIGDTLTSARNGLPDVESMASARVIYEDANPMLTNPSNGSVRFIDYTAERKVPLDGTINGQAFTLGSLDLAVELAAAGRYRFRDLPFALKSRLSFDPINKQLIFAGYKEVPAAGVPLVLLNVMSTQERERLLAFDGTPGATGWDSAINALYALTRNPNGVTGGAANAYYVGLQGTSAALTYADALGPKALTAGKATALGYVTLTENNAPGLGAAPISLHILRVINPPVVGEIKVIKSDNALDDKLTLRHSNDFAGDPDGLTFEWLRTPAVSGTSPPLPGQPNAPTWFPLATGAGVNEVTLEGAGLVTLADSWLVCRYKGYSAGGYDPNAYTDWAGDPASTPNDRRAAFAPGWIKRVLGGIGPFEARVRDFASAPTQTYSSFIAQAGGRYEGAVALNNDPDNLNSLGLIALYETVLERGLNLSINGTPPAGNDAVYNALLLVATRLSDFYMLLGNEAYADAQDPTIGFTSADGGVGSLAPSLFAFANQVPNLISEELTLLRGRDNSSAGVGAAPVYNRLFWNFTGGLEGEPVYVQNYGITDQNADGLINEIDARSLFPQGHGDGWGHYLTAVKYAYRLLRHPSFTWIPRTETTSVGGVAIEVDYLDERKFANAAAARAAAGAEIVNLTYRERYVADPSGQWQGYRDSDTARAWGVDEWARRAGQGAYFDWITANAILPAVHQHPLGNVNGPAPAGLQKIDRTTVPELEKIAASYGRIQAQMDQADRGLNPLGVTPGSIPFDIDPAFLVIGSGIQGKKHFEQVYERTISAVKGARRIFDYANELTQRLRQTHISADEFAQDVLDSENNFRSRLVEVFGYPYAGDIGAGKTFPSGYNGPDIYHYNYVAVTDVSGASVIPNTAVTGFFKPFGQDYPTPVTAPSQPSDFTQVVNHFFANDTPNPTTSANNILQVEFPLSTGATASRWAFAAPTSWGQRRAPGTLQFAISDMVRADAELRRGKLDYDNHIAEIQDQLDLLRARFNVQTSQINILNTQRNEIRGMNTAIGTFRGISSATGLASTIIANLGEAASDAIPKVVGLAVDAFSGVRGAIKLTSGVVRSVLDAGTATANLAADSIELAKEDVANRTAIEIQKAGFAFEVQQHLKSIEALLREEVGLRLDLFNLRLSLQDANGNYLKTLAEGQEVLEERKRFRRKVAGAVQQNRYQDLTFRLFRNEALQKYRASFDLAAQYVYMAATTYDFETCQLSGNAAAGRRFLTDIVRERALGQFIDDQPVAGVNGLSDPLGRLDQNYQVLKTRLGVNNPQIESSRFSLRREAFRIREDSDEAWQELLQSHRVADLWQVPEFRRFCRPFAPETAGAQPGLVIPFSSDITFGQNYFGLPLAGGDGSYDSTNFATKINAAGVWFGNYNAAGLSTTPRVYLIPAGLDIMRAPDDVTLSTREFDVVDQAIPVPFPVGNSDLTNPNWIPSNNLDTPMGNIRRFGRFRAYHDDGFELGDFTKDTRLVGRSVWNTKWLLIIPGGTFLNDPVNGLDTFILGLPVPGTPQRDGNGNTDIQFLFETYGYSGN